MRSDKNLKNAFGGSGVDLNRFGMSPFHSWSGHERDHLFLNSGGAFVEASAISGLDSPLDGRAFGVLDFDRDGFSDLAVVNANAPQLQLYRNRFGDPGPERGLQGAPPVIAIRFVGGNTSPEAARGLGNRDGYGVRVTAQVGGRALVREHRCGEGLGAQNSATLMIGLGKHPAADSLTVRWPSGKSHKVDNVAAGTLLTAYEVPGQSADGQAFVRDVWRPAQPRPVAMGGGRGEERLVAAGTEDGAQAKLRAYTTLATWCAACKDELPQVALLRSTFSSDDLALYGVPADENDDRGKLAGFAATYRPAYKVMVDAPAAFRGGVNALVLARLKADSLPATVVTDGDGRILRVSPGVPTVSDLRRLLARDVR